MPARRLPWIPRVAGILLALWAAACAQFTEAPGNPISVGSIDPASMAVGDFNGDGVQDLVIVGSAAPDLNGLTNCNSVSSLLGDGKGGFTPAPGSPFTIHWQSSPNGAIHCAVAVGDFNGDGKLDLVIANSASVPNVAVLLGDGKGGFTEAPGSPFPGGAYAIAVADFNGDGVLDLAIANLGGNTVAVLLGDGTGKFTATDKGSPFTVGDTPASVVVGDFNGDGSPDLAVASLDGTVTVLLGDGKGGFTRATGCQFTVGELPTLAVGDFNGDGKLDLAVASSPNGSPTVTVLTGDGKGAFTGNPFWGMGIYTTTSLAAADFNGDNRSDLAVVTLEGTVTVLLSDGKGGFTRSPSIPVVSATAIAVGDFNGDDKPDLAVASWASGEGNVTVLINSSPTPTPTPAPTPVPVKPVSPVPPKKPPRRCNPDDTPSPIATEAKNPCR